MSSLTMPASPTSGLAKPAALPTLFDKVRERERKKETKPQNRKENRNVVRSEELDLGWNNLIQ